MDNVTALHRELKGEWDKPAPNLRKCGKLLDDLKVSRCEDFINCRHINSSLINENKYLNLNSFC